MRFISRAKRVLYILLFFLVLTTMSPAYAQAPTDSLPQTSVQQNNQQIIYGNVEADVPRNLHTLSQSVFIEAISSVTCMLAGRDPLNPKGTCLTFNPDTKKIGYAKTQGGIAQFMGGLIAGTAAIPISSKDYVDYSINNFGIVKNSYAATGAPSEAGSGFSRLAPLIGIWARFRDLAYLFFVLAFTIIGLAIMFRVKLDARTVMTIQNQIPKIVIALTLVTFSYAIAGFLIDLMYVSIYFIVITFSTITPAHVNVNASVFGVFNKVYAPNIHPVGQAAIGVGSGGSGLVYDIGTSGIIGLSIKTSSGIAGVLGGLTADFLDSTISKLFQVPFVPFKALDLGCNVLSFVSQFSLPALIGKLPGIGGALQNIPVVGGLFGGGADCDFAQSFFETAVAFVFGTIAFLVVLIAIIYTLFRVWITLIKSFIYVLIDAMVGPLWIAAGIFPGSKLGFTTWVRHLMGHLSVFPMTFAVILLGKTIMDAVAGGGLFAPPLIGDSIGGNTSFAAFVGFGFILSIPSILDRTRKAVGAMDFGVVDVKKSFGVGTGVPRSAFGTVATAKTKTAHVGEAPGLWRTLSGKI